MFATLNGLLTRQPFAVGGSGSFYVYGFVDAEYRRGMSREECQKFVVNSKLNLIWDMFWIYFLDKSCVVKTKWSVVVLLPPLQPSLWRWAVTAPVVAWPISSPLMSTAPKRKSYWEMIYPLSLISDQRNFYCLKSATVVQVEINHFCSIMVSFQLSTHSA